ncbi:MAG: class I SAM-dependent methyltransferase [Rubrivivax sp.]
MPSLSTLIDARLTQLSTGLALEWPGGSAGAGSGAQVRLRLRHKRQLASLLGGQIGHLADAYVRGEVDIEGSLADVMAIAGELVGDPVQDGARSLWTRWLASWRSRWAHRLHRDAAQVQFHYDVSDDFYALWLDPLRVYSCAFFADPVMPLATAQQAKLDLVCRKLQLARGQHFLDIGAGWGGLLLWAAQHYGVQATGVTLSRNQHAHVNRLIDERGLRGQVEMRLMDYREIPADERYDRIASIGMFEHVGLARMHGYFGKLQQLLRPGGLLLNHAIASGGLGNAELGAGMGRFIEKHIFPGGEILHVSQAARGLAGAGLELLDAENLRPHYARTLWHWSQGLESKLEQARLLTSEATVRAYRLYLAGSAMCFERGWLALYQLLAARAEEQRPALTTWATRSDYPFNRRHMLQG